ncbi:hypothetical protein R0I52_06555 [Psychrobacter sp. CAM01]|uniref:hypothetical protein n=1 Tax=Psychrobacter sp. CAM01 TaxID=3080335 RepID=UPI0029364523|nr:hypothetical protein [Psychrobacter sp. CAM01]MDV2860367.1 hypothetical protein [Psychrobacter sp. CAM01]
MVTTATHGTAGIMMKSCKSKSAALLTGIAKWLIENNKVNTDFITTHTSGFEPLKQWLTEKLWTDIEQGCGMCSITGLT